MPQGCDILFSTHRTDKKSIAGCESAIKLFESISGWKDADEQIYACQRKIEEIKAKEEADRLERERQAEQKRIADEKAAKKRKKIIAITTPIVVACIAFLIVLTTVIIPSSKYNSAISLIDEGEYVEAYEALIDLNYKDSATKAKEIYGQYKAEKLKTAKVGDYVFFGSYEQDDNTSNGKEDVEWLVLAKEGDKALVISKYALDCQQYNTEYTDVTWETCSLRKWLNGTFISNAFSSDEQSMIQSTTVTADKNPSYSTSPGNNTTDKVFLLSITEINKYFSSDSARQCRATANAAYRYSSNNCRWWLRTPGNNFHTAATLTGDGSVFTAAFVSEDGSVYINGFLVDDDNVAVRPALWINLGS